MLDEVGHQVAEEVAFIPAVIRDEAFGVANVSPGVIQEVLEIEVPKDVSQLGSRIAQPNEDGHHGTCRGASHAFDVFEDAFSVKHLKGANIGDTFHATTFEDKVSKVVLAHVVVLIHGMLDFSFNQPPKRCLPCHPSG